MALFQPANAVQHTLMNKISSFTTRYSFVLIALGLAIFVFAYTMMPSSEEPSRPLLLPVPEKPLAEPEPETPKLLPSEQRADNVQLITLAYGQNLTRLLGQHGISSRRVTLLAMAAKDLIDLGRLRVGTPIEVSSPDKHQHFVRLAREYGEIVEAHFNGKRWTVRLTHSPLANQVEEKSLPIHNSFYQDAEQQNVPVDIINSAILAMSHFVDFQRQVQPGDQLEVRYERSIATRDVDLFKHLQTPLTLTYLRFVNDGEDYRLIRFNGHFYFPDGLLAQNFLLKTPLNGARLSSFYGNRYHPVLGYTRQHKGIDFSAPIGTPIMAAGDGVIQRAEVYGGYGNAIVIEHSNQYQTLYGHLQRFAQNLKPGDRVKQGDIIGYLGNSGLSSARHLHYEVHHRGRVVNPLDLKIPSKTRLQGDALLAFQSHVQQLLDTGSALASLNPAHSDSLGK